MECLRKDNIFRKVSGRHQIYFKRFNRINDVIDTEYLAYSYVNKKRHDKLFLEKYMQWE